MSGRATLLPQDMVQILDRYNRATLAAFAELAINRLDELDGDPDVELNGDETDHDRAEDCFTIGPNDHAYGSGCPIADPGGCQHDGSEPEDSY